MAEYNKAQVSSTISGDLWVIRADSGEDLADVISGVAEHANTVFDGLNELKQVGVAKGVFTGDAKKQQQKERSADSPPPVEADNSDAPPTCQHGEMVDLRGRGYKRSFYCSLKTDNWREKCKPVD